jgi:hypothetical protein
MHRQSCLEVIYTVNIKRVLCREFCPNVIVFVQPYVADMDVVIPVVDAIRDDWRGEVSYLPLIARLRT